MGDGATDDVRVIEAKRRVRIKRLSVEYGYAATAPPPNVMREIVEEVDCECGAAGSGEPHEPFCPVKRQK
jgi:hypothetical protein